MVHEAALLESQTLRASVAGRTEVLDKVRALSLLPDGMHVTTRMVANYFEVAERTVNRLMQRHRDELTENGMRTLRGSELELFKRDILSLFPESYPQPRSGLTLFTRRAVLNVAMLLRDSDVARQVRTYLLDTEQAARAVTPTAPVDDAAVHNLISWLDQRIARAVAAQRPPQPPVDEARVREIAEETVRRVMGQAVVPLLNQVIRSDAELREQLAGTTAEMGRLRRALRERGAASFMAALDDMSAPEIAQHVARLCRRDGCEEVTVTRGRRDDGTDVLGYTAGGRRLVARCVTRGGTRASAPDIEGAEVRRFLGTSEAEHEAEVSMLVATVPFTREALSSAHVTG